MEIFVALEHLTNKFGTDNRAVTLNQAALRLLREQHLGNSGHCQRIGKSGDERLRDMDDDRRTNFAQHVQISSSQMHRGDNDVDGGESELRTLERGGAGKLRSSGFGRARDRAGGGARHGAIRSGRL